MKKFLFLLFMGSVVHVSNARPCIYDQISDNSKVVDVKDSVGVAKMYGNNLITLVQEYLTNEGYKYEIDKDGDIYFKYQGRGFYFEDPKDDLCYFRILMLPIYKIENDREKVLEAINTVTAELKLLKAYILENELWIAVEMFVDSTPNIEEFFERCLGILCTGRSAFAREIFSE